MRRSRRLRWAAIPLAGLGVAALAGCTQQQQLGWLPTEPGLTDNVDSVIGLWVNSWIVLLLVGVVTWGLILWAMIAYRRRKGQTGLPVQLRYNMPVEIFYTVVPLILVLGFFVSTVRVQVPLEDQETPDLTVQVYAKQWAWSFVYADDNVYYQGIQAQENPDGTVNNEQLPRLVLPVDQTVRFEITSRDVIHSFWIIEFLYKKDAIPGKWNYMTVTPQEIGTYRGKCAELCGQYHSLMLFEVDVVSQEDYDAYIQSLRDAGNVGDLPGDLNRITSPDYEPAGVEEGDGK